jgi:signal transduction histidine kinase
VPETGNGSVSAFEAPEYSGIAREHADLLLELSMELSRASTLVEVTAACMAAAKRAFSNSVGTIICRRTDAGDELEILAVSELPGQVFENWQRFSIDSNAPLAHAVSEARLVALESPSAWENAYPHLIELLETTGHRAQLISPMIAGGAAIGAIGIAFATDQSFSSSDKKLVCALAAQCAIAIERARLFDKEKEARMVAENANRIKSDFLASLSHELRTPLNAIGGYAELMQLGIHGPVSEAQQNTLDRIQASQRHMQGLINAVLEFSRIEAGVVQFQIEDISLEETLRICEAVISPQLQERHVDYTPARIDPSITVQADAEKLRQILINLLGNAVKYTDPGGRVSLVLETDADSAYLRVSDTGHGISAGNLEIIFDPFVRLQTAAVSSPGAGLGLAISKSLARGMASDLVVESQLGEGSTFTLKVPLGGTH